MLKKCLLLAISWVLMVGMAWAQQWEIQLSAGAKSATGGVHYRQYVDTGFFKVGGTGTYASDDEESYRLGTVDFLVGTDTLSPGLTIEVGLRGILGEAEDDPRSGDVGAAGFAGDVEYVFSPDITPIPVEVFGNITYAPESLSFRDTRSYFEMSLGSGVRIGRYASIRLSYTTYQIDLESGSTNWKSNDDVIRLGLVMRF